MQFGICVDWKSDAKLQAAKEAGVDFVELNFASFDAVSEDEIAALKEKLDALGLTVASYNGMFPGTIRLTGKDRDFAAGAAYLDRMLAKLSVLGARHVVFGSSLARRMEEGSNREEAMAELTVFLRDYVSPLLHKYGWLCSVEPLSECNFLRSTADGAELAARVNTPEIRLLADLYHVAKVGEPDDALAACGARLAHIHIACRDGRFFPSSSDPDDYAEWFRRLARAGYDGRISVEGGVRDKENFAAEAKEAIACLRAAYAQA